MLEQTLNLAAYGLYVRLEVAVKISSIKGIFLSLYSDGGTAQLLDFSLRKRFPGESGRVFLHREGNVLL